MELGLSGEAASCGTTQESPTMTTTTMIMIMMMMMITCTYTSDITYSESCTNFSQVFTEQTKALSICACLINLK
jgi:hypothetical protein